jgi:hypothetical protein
VAILATSSRSGAELVVSEGFVFLAVPEERSGEEQLHEHVEVGFNQVYDSQLVDEGFAGLFFDEDVDDNVPS